MRPALSGAGPYCARPIRPFERVNSGRYVGLLTRWETIAASSGFVLRGGE